MWHSLIHCLLHCFIDVFWSRSQPESTSLASLLITSLQTNSFTEDGKQLIPEQPHSSTLQTTSTTSTVLQALQKSTESVELCVSEKPRFRSKPELGNRTLNSSLTASNFPGDLENVTELHQESNNNTRLQAQEKFNKTNSSRSYYSTTRSGEQLWPHRKQKDRARSSSDSTSRYLKRRIPSNVNKQSLILNVSLSEREPAALNTTSSPSKVNEVKEADDQLAFSSYLGMFRFSTLDLCLCSFPGRLTLGYLL